MLATSLSVNKKRSHGPDASRHAIIINPATYDLHIRWCAPRLGFGINTPRRKPHAEKAAIRYAAPHRPRQLAYLPTYTGEAQPRESARRGVERERGRKKKGAEIAPAGVFGGQVAGRRAVCVVCISVNSVYPPVMPD